MEFQSRQDVKRIAQSRILSGASRNPQSAIRILKVLAILGLLFRSNSTPLGGMAEGEIGGEFYPSRGIKFICNSAFKA
ncbi:MAG: hypothetical protein QME81_17880 [bacterium]|nr:hypothetical protein [bacterium]